MRRPVIGFAGLTHLGLNSAVVTASKGFSTVGYHNDTQLVALLNSGKPHVLEPQLLEFHELTAANIVKSMNGRVVLDPYRILNGKDLVKNGFTYATLGEPIRQPLKVSN